MELEKIKQVTVIGAGTMGSQIAEVFSRVGKYAVTMVDTTDERTNAGYQAIQTRLKKHFVEKGKMTTTEADEVLARIKRTTDIGEASKNADFVTEAVFENLALKKSVFKQVDDAAASHAIIASNTSALSITEMAATTKRPDKVVGTHYFNPVAVMKLVEVVRGALTSSETIDTTQALMQKLRKSPVVCKDTFGFLANRAHVAMVREAVQMVWERVAPPQDIDKALREGYNLPMGPLEVYDYTGGWAILASSEQDKVKELGETGRLHPLVRMMIRAGYTGKPNKGIYDFWNEVLAKW